MFHRDETWKTRSFSSVERGSQHEWVGNFFAEFIAAKFPKIVFRSRSAPGIRHTCALHPIYIAVFIQIQHRIENENVKNIVQRDEWVPLRSTPHAKCEYFSYESHLFDYVCSTFYTGTLDTYITDTNLNKGHIVPGVHNPYRVTQFTSIFFASAIVFIKHYYIGNGILLLLHFDCGTCSFNGFVVMAHHWSEWVCLYEREEDNGIHKVVDVGFSWFHPGKWYS